MRIFVLSKPCFKFLNTLALLFDHLLLFFNQFGLFVALFVLLDELFLQLVDSPPVGESVKGVLPW